MSGAVLRTSASGAVAFADDDILSTKVGDWGYAQVLPNASKPVAEDIPGAFAAKPTDAVVMDYLEGILANTSLPVAHLYDSALEALTKKVNDSAVSALLEQDLELRHYLKARRIGDVYE